MSDADTCTICRYPLRDIFPLVMTRCRHVFHRDCIVNWLVNGKNCPICRAAVTKTSLLDYEFIEQPIPQEFLASGTSSNRRTERVLLSKNARKRNNDSNRNFSFPPNNDTDLPSANFQQDLEIPSSTSTVSTTPGSVPILSSSVSVSNTSVPTPIVSSNQDNESRLVSNLTNQFQSEIARLNNVISQMSEQLNNLRIPEVEWPNPPISNILNFDPPLTNRPTTLTVSSTPTFPRLSTQVTNANYLSHARNINNRNPVNTNLDFPPISNSFSNNTQTFNYPHNTFPNINRPISMYDINNNSKIASIIHNWNITYNGSPTGMPVEKFICMVNALVNDTLGGDFSLLSDHCSSLFSGKAKEWFWSFRIRSPNRINWISLCNELRAHYHDHLSDADIRKLLDSRKQQKDENFDDFYHAILQINDRLRFQLSEEELIEILRQNVKPYIRRELFYLQISSVSQLRNLILRREALTAELEGNFAIRNYRRQVNEVDETCPEPLSEDVSELRRHRDNKLICFNCKKEGHTFRNCLETPTIFCYTCGNPGVYKSNCDTCSGNSRTDKGNNTSLRPSQ